MIRFPRWVYQVLSAVGLIFLLAGIIAPDSASIATGATTFVIAAFLLGWFRSSEKKPLSRFERILIRLAVGLSVFTFAMLILAGASVNATLATALAVLVLGFVAYLWLATHRTPV